MVDQHQTIKLIENKKFKKKSLLDKLSETNSIVKNEKPSRCVRDKISLKFKPGFGYKTISHLSTSHESLFNPSSENNTTANLTRHAHCLKLTYNSGRGLRALVGKSADTPRIRCELHKSGPMQSFEDKRDREIPFKAAVLVKGGLGQC